tara:strand:+ start:91 stop:1365 length:1275 start_codon:yes stop_codon:yes gene_type:complete
MKKNILSKETQKLILYCLDSKDFEKAPKLLKLSNKKFQRLMIDNKELLDDLDVSQFSQSQALLILNYLHLYISLHSKNLQTNRKLKTLRKIFNINEQYLSSIFAALKRLNPNQVLNNRTPLESIINPTDETAMWAINVVYSFIKAGKYVDKKLIPGLSYKEYQHSFDKKALEALQKTPGLEAVVRKFNQYGLEKILKVNYTGSYIKVDKDNFPEVHRALLHVCEVLDQPQIPDLYIMTDFINGFTIGVEKPMIVISSGSVGLLSYDELLFLLAHEVGHIKSQHVLYYQMAQVVPMMGDLLSSVTLGLGGLFSTGIQVALLNWQRKAEFTADRAGLLACQNVEAATTVMMKLAGAPPRFYGSLKAEDFKRQAKEFEGFDEDNLDKVAKTLSVMLSTHPWTVMRGSELYKWVEAGHYDNILNRKLG